MFDLLWECVIVMCFYKEVKEELCLIQMKGRVFFCTIRERQFEERCVNASYI